jgi:hypothetical protein
VLNNTLVKEGLAARALTFLSLEGLAQSKWPLDMLHFIKKKRNQTNGRKSSFTKHAYSTGLVKW